MAQVQYSGTGRRKNAVARVRLVPGTGKITVNKKDVEEYIPHADLREVINQPFGVTETKGAYDVIVNVNGGGYAGQSGAIRHGIARALLQVDPDFRSALKRAGLLTRDARMVERKKPGLKKALIIWSRCERVRLRKQSGTKNSLEIECHSIIILKDTFQFGKCLFLLG